MNFREYIQQGFVFLDGATGSNLQEHGMQAGECPELWILNHPDVFVEYAETVYSVRKRCALCADIYL